MMKSKIFSWVMLAQLLWVLPVSAQTPCSAKPFLEIAYTLYLMADATTNLFAASSSALAITEVQESDPTFVDNPTVKGEYLASAILFSASTAGAAALFFGRNCACQFCCKPVVNKGIHLGIASMVLATSIAGYSTNRVAYDTEEKRVVEGTRGSSLRHVKLSYFLSLGAFVANILPVAVLIKETVQASRSAETLQLVHNEPATNV